MFAYKVYCFTTLKDELKNVRFLPALLEVLGRLTKNLPIAEDLTDGDRKKMRDAMLV